MQKQPTLVIYVLATIALALTGCATSTGGGGVGGVVIDAPQKEFKATITGTVLSDGKAIPNAQIEFINYDVTGITDSNGRFEIEFSAMTRLGVNRLRVLVRASKEGYRSRTRGVYVVIQQRASMIIELLPKADR